MIKQVLGLLSVILLSTHAQAQPSAELDATQLENNQWRITIDVDSVENVFGLQAELSFPEGNIEVTNKNFTQSDLWPIKGKIELRNLIQESGAQYAVSLVRPANPVSLNDTVLQFDIKLSEFKPTLITLDKLKVSNIKGQVTKFDINNTNLIIGEKPNLWPYALIPILLIIFTLITLYRVKKRSKLANNMAAA
jgi:hypothetical protein